MTGEREGAAPNASDAHGPPLYPRFDSNTLGVVAAYSALFAVAAVGNVTVFASLLRGRRRRSRVGLMMAHLAAADLIITFVMMPLEVGWRLTTQWVAGNAACKLFLFLRAFGLYLSSNVLVCVSLDRYFAILHPLKVSDARRRGKLMLAAAWAVSLLCSAPQSVVFHVSAHPDFPEFRQCVTFGFFSSAAEEIAYNLFCVAAMYFVPLVVICVAYSRILCEITRKSHDSRVESSNSSQDRFKDGRLRLRRSDVTSMERAKARTLRMTITIVAAFIWCWTPYVVMTLWYTFDRESAQQVDTNLQDALFIMAVSNSCMNPLVYGSYAINFRRECGHCFRCILRSQKENAVTMQKEIRQRQLSSPALQVRSGAQQPRVNYGGCFCPARDDPQRSESSSCGHVTFHSDPPPGRQLIPCGALRASSSVDQARWFARSP
ncbi:adipokinetic hormone/corazonin-related peptide receptor variant I-like [Bacillus rossius redtenbacheri]|uniref:adipokinetic hormone/corazonin-related peptide receptor variant I-like n=1 Tax=Bacillus rossius redtenbacheri TaxID=93214 RepID=UPI002FDE1547